MSLRALALLIISLSLLGACGCSGSTAEQAKPSTPDKDQDSPIFSDITAELGVDFVHEIGRAGTFQMQQIVTAGGALLDFDVDGDLDLYLVNGNIGDSLVPAETLGDEPTNRLFRQEEDGRFVDVTEGSGLADSSYGMGVAVGDVNNDGYPDIYLSNYGADRLFLNQQDGTFKDVSSQTGIDNDHFSPSACFVDINRDGWLDLYVTNYLDYFPSKNCYNIADQRIFCGPGNFKGQADKLYLNQTGQLAADEDKPPMEVGFEDISLSSGISRKRGRGLGVTALDFNGDQWLDLYVANDMDDNYLWINQQDGTFKDEAVIYGAAYDLHGEPQGSMGIAIGDLNQDGVFDLVLTHTRTENNAVYVSDGKAGYREQSAQLKLSAPSLQWTGFGTALADLDHNGQLDLLVVNGGVQLPSSTKAKQGHGTGTKQQVKDAKFWQPYAEPNQLFLNEGQAKFRELAENSDPYTSKREISRGLCCGDLDNDGDIDLVVINAAGPARIYRNDAKKAGHWLMVRALLPHCGGRDAYGATITLKAGDAKWMQPVNPGSSYLSSHDPRVHFGLGNVTNLDAIQIQWPDGTTETFPGCKVDQHVVLRRGEGTGS